MNDVFVTLSELGFVRFVDDLDFGELLFCPIQ